MTNTLVHIPINALNFFMYFCYIFVVLIQKQNLTILMRDNLTVLFKSKQFFFLIFVVCLNYAIKCSWCYFKWKIRINAHSKFVFKKVTKNKILSILVFFSTKGTFLIVISQFTVTFPILINKFHIRIILFD